jgi:hypothetical protein
VNAAGERPRGGPPSTQPRERAEEATATGDAFDFRIVRLSARRHIDQPRVCDIVFVGRLEQLGAEPVPPHPPGTTRRVDVKCASETGESWIDLGFERRSAEAAPALQAGRRILVRVVARHGGFSDYTVAAFLSEVGAAAPHARPALAPSVEPGFDFGRLATGIVPADRDQPCGVDFASHIEVVDSRRRTRHGYPEDVRTRMSVKCVSAEGDSWIDLVFAPSDGLRPLLVTRGSTVRVRILSADGGHAGRPVVTLTPG